MSRYTFIVLWPVSPVTGAPIGISTLYLLFQRTSASVIGLYVLWIGTFIFCAVGTIIQTDCKNIDQAHRDVESDVFAVV